MKKTQSSKFHLNKEDIRKQLKQAFIWSVPLLLFYLDQLNVVITAGKLLSWADLLPNSTTLIAGQYYVLSQLYGLFKRWIAGV